MQGLTKLLDQRKVQFPWLASAIADFYALEAERDAWKLGHKKRPAIKTADVVRTRAWSHETECRIQLSDDALSR
jgi:hypothetical protein